jgi:hypothetical protein
VRGGRKEWINDTGKRDRCGQTREEGKETGKQGLLCKRREEVRQTGNRDCCGETREKERKGYTGKRDC